MYPNSQAGDGGQAGYHVDGVVAAPCPISHPRQ